MTTRSILLMCCEVSHQQVKQKKKCSNKWNCVVCNEKQSVQKVFAQGFMAKDVRKFVQNFNMSRQHADQQSANQQTLVPQSEEIDSQYQSNPKKMRTDWSEYIEPEENEGPTYLKNEGDQEDEFGKKFVTELPKALFRKPKLRNYSVRSDTDDGEKLFKPVFSKRNADKQTRPLDMEKSKCGGTMAKVASKWRDCTKKGDGEIIADKEPISYQPHAVVGASKWSEYINEENDFADDVMGEWNNVEFEGTMNEKVEDDIHPDFQ
ncbi:hypothetical protein LguiA_004231 [Lonicera macranthoides]